MRENLLMWLAWRMPRGLVYWCVIRVWAAATTGEYGSEEGPAIRVETALKRWDDGRRAVIA
jgi:hypothetical protein